MATAAPAAPPVLATRRHPFTVEDFHRMGEAGVLTERDRVELIEGEIVDMNPIGLRHAACVDRLTELLAEALQKRATLRVQNPLDVGERTTLQPDLCLLRRSSDFYASRAPTPADTLLVIEVADSSLPYDRGVKLPLYARSGVPEVWLVDLEAGRIEVHREPMAAGYCLTRRVFPGDRIAPEALPGLELAVADVLV
jgi:Uma2 family endonuclease